MSGDDNKRAVAEFVERCQTQHDLAFADEAFHPEFGDHYRPEGRAIPETDRPASGFQAFYGALLQGFPDASVEINEQLAQRDLVATRKTFRGARDLKEYREWYAQLTAVSSPVANARAVLLSPVIMKK